MIKIGKYRFSVGRILLYAFLFALTFVLVYPLLWMVSASFKSNNEIFSSTSLIPKKWVFTAYADGWKTAGKYTFTTFYLNSAMLVFPVIIATLVSSVIVAYGFARFNFTGKKILFSMLIGTMLLPAAVMIIPRYLLFRDFGWLNTYLPFIVPNLFANSAFFVYMLIQFFRGIPRELDESAKIDGCSSWGILVRIILPLSKPALISVFIFQFIWTWNDFLNPLIYINTVAKYPVSLGIRMTMDQQQGLNWCNILAMSVLAVLPGVVIYAFLQRYFVEGIATSGLKG